MNPSSTMVSAVNKDLGSPHLLEVQDLVTEFRTEDGIVRAVDGVSFHIGKSETLGMVGESGSGKSVTSLSLMGLIRPPAGRIVRGKVLFEGEDLRGEDSEQLRRLRGDKIAMIFQEPMTSLNPVLRVGFQISESIKVHKGLTDEAATKKAIDLLSIVGIPAPERRVREFPHQLSGGMRQRVMIAMALSCNPSLLIADEPTTALDVTVQAQILELMRRLKSELGMSILLITHDMGVIAEMAERVAVMYAGRIVEVAEVRDLFSTPLHPYTQGLLASIPTLETSRGKLRVIEGTVPSLFDMPKGCRFHPRCPDAFDRCRVEDPGLADRGGRAVACFKHQPVSREVESL